MGFARANVPLGEDHARYLRFLDEGMHGEMAYLAEHQDTRQCLDTEAILPGARTVICVARRYDRGAAEASDPPLAGTVARYARGRDYHGFLRKQLRKLAASVRELEEGAEARPLVDAAPLLERAWAARAGLGFVGKNGMLIVPGQGSYCLLGEVVTTLDLLSDEPTTAPWSPAMTQRCGSCTLCLDACPTDAFAAPYVLDARRCVSYATIEQRAVADEQLWPALGEHLFGCDVCQEVCPYNRVAPPPPEDTEPFRPLPRWSSVDLLALVKQTPSSWLETARGTPLRRATRQGLAQNACHVAANRLAAGDESGRQVLESACHHDDARVRALASRLLSRHST